MCKFIHVGKSNELILCKLSKSDVLRLYSIVHVAMESTKMSNYLSIKIFHQIWQMTHSQTAKAVSSHLNGLRSVEAPIAQCGRASALITKRSKVLFLLGVIAFFPPSCLCH